EVVGVDRAEQGIVDARRPHLGEPRLCGHRGELEVLRIHVAVGARAGVAAESRGGSVVKARLASTQRRIDRHLRRSRRTGGWIDSELGAVAATTAARAEHEADKRN